MEINTRKKYVKKRKHKTKTSGLRSLPDYLSRKESNIMKQKAMEMKLVVRPLVGCLTHTHFWEGPCRAGRYEDMTVEAETKAAD